MIRLHATRRDGDPAATPLVLGHGIFLDSTIWDAVLPGLGDRTVVLVDGPGHGGSGPAAPGWSLADHAAALIDVLDAHDLPAAALAGHSWGGMVALRAALAHPDRVTALGLINTPLAATAGLGRLGFRAQAAVLQATGPSAFFARRAAAALYADPDHAAVQRLAGRIAGRPGAVLADAVRAVILGAEDHTRQVGAVTVPVVVAAGERDYVLTPAVRATLAATAPAADVRVLRGGHVSPEEDPAGVVAALAGLLTRSGVS